MNNQIPYLMNNHNSLYNPNNNYNNLEFEIEKIINKINRLEKNIRIIENRLNKLEMNKTTNYNDDPTDMYII